MKVLVGSTPLNSVMLHTDTDDATLVASDLQLGVTAYAKGIKVVGSGKAFAFAVYGDFSSNDTIPIPVSTINTINVSSNTNAVKLTNRMFDFRNLDFSTTQTVALINIDGIDYDVNFIVKNDKIYISCDKDITLQVMVGKDEYL